MSNRTFRVVNAADQDKSEIDRFLSRVYRPEKARFLSQHRHWWYRGARRLLVVLAEGNRVVAHSAMVPVRCVLNGRVQDALWWVDLIVDPEFRGRGLQTMLDDQVRAAAGLTFAFPARELSGKMFQKHGWEVNDACLHLTLPLDLTAFERIRYVRGWKRSIVQLLTALTWLPARSFRLFLSRYRPQTARLVESPRPEVLADVFLRHNESANVFAGVRDAEFLQWRYLDAPYFHECRFYCAGPRQAPSHVLVSRICEWDGIKVARILDVFGDFDDAAGLRDVLRLAIRDAVRAGAVKIVAIASVAPLVRSLRRLGFLLTDELRFCWHTQDPALRQALANGPQVWHWTFGDSDCDRP